MADTKHDQPLRFIRPLLASALGVADATFNVVRDFGTSRRQRSSARSFSFQSPVEISPFTNMSSSKSVTVSFPRRRRGKKRKMSAMNVAKKALSISRSLRNKVEVKMFDNLVSTIANVGTTGVVTDLARVAQGDGHTNRDGQFLAPFWLSLRLHWIGDPLAIRGIYRTIIFRDKRQIASTDPTVLEFLVENHALSQPSSTQRSRWKVLFDRTWTTDNATNITQNRFINVNVKLSLKMQFSGGASTTISMNGLYMLNISNLAAAQPDLDFSSRMFFNDP